jgi:ABC-type phosphate/phosphonate transport system substrate-binding protein
MRSSLPSLPPQHTALAFGVVSGDRAARPALELICKELAERTEHVIYPQVLGSYADLSAKTQQGALHVLWAPPLVAHELQKLKAALVAVYCRRETGTVYHSALFTRRDLGARSAEDLRGRRAAWVDRESLSGYVLARRWIALHGVDPETLFARQTFAKTHSAVARAVLRGEADVGATYVNFIPNTRLIRSAGWVETGASADAVHVIASIGPIPSDSILVSRRVEEALRERIVSALLDLSSAARGAARDLFHTEGFDRAVRDHAAAFARLLGEH